MCWNSWLIFGLLCVEFISGITPVRPKKKGALSVSREGSIQLLQNSSLSTPKHNSTNGKLKPRNDGSPQANTGTGGKLKSLAITTDTHIDLPGQHGNTASVPVVHRKNTHPVDPISKKLIVNDSIVHTTIHKQYNTQPPASVVHGQPVSTHTDVHVDFPGEHGNQSPHPVVHRPSLGGTSKDRVISDVHVDFPGEHGNQSPHPVVHRPSLGGTSKDRVILDVHVDFPGEHGNQSPHPVVHRPSAGSSPKDHVILDVHADFPGQHGNSSTFPVLHRDSGSTQTKAHVDLPGVHGNQASVPVVHRQTGNQAFNTQVDLADNGHSLNGQLFFGRSNSRPGDIPVSGTSNGHAGDMPMFVPMFRYPLLSYTDAVIFNQPPLFSHDSVDPGIIIPERLGYLSSSAVGSIQPFNVNFGSQYFGSLPFLDYTAAARMFNMYRQMSMRP